MDYKVHYNTLIERAKNRLLECYAERHHIVPKCMGGSDDTDNLVALTPEEHYVAHQLLTKMHPDNKGLVYAALLMGLNANGNRPNNKIYGWLKTRLSEKLKGREFSDETRKRISEAKKGKKFSEAHKKALSVARKKVVSNFKGKTHTIEARMILSEKLKGRRPERVTCPHCSKEGGKPIMTRYHFDKCKKAIAYG